MKRPWGSYRVIHKSEHCLVKKITLNPRSRTSLQSHCYRGEIWSFISGCGKAIIQDQTIDIVPGAILYINECDKHRIINSSNKPLELIEMQYGHIIDEGDIVRIEDDYGRK